LPQVFYYAWASLAFAPALTTFSVPSGNFGNLTAGLIAKRLGFPIDGFIAATNVNDVVPEYLSSGRYSPRPSIRTVANAMDVGAPSNFERMQVLYGHDVERVRDDIRGVAFDDRQVTAAIHDVDERYGYVLDPHSAIAWLGLVGQGLVVGLPFRAASVFVATAHPAKFRETVEPAIGRPVPLPPALADALSRPRHITRIAPQLSELTKLLR
jgi:threonine synthase